jgi:hypothetical protein
MQGRERQDRKGKAGKDNADRARQGNARQAA